MQGILAIQGIATGALQPGVAACNPGILHMTAHIGIGSIVTGGYQSFNTDRLQVALIGVPDGLRELIPALLGLLALLGTALLGLAMIRLWRDVVCSVRFIAAETYLGRLPTNPR